MKTTDFSTVDITKNERCKEWKKHTTDNVRWKKESLNSISEKQTEWSLA